MEALLHSFHLFGGMKCLLKFDGAPINWIELDKNSYFGPCAQYLLSIH